MRILKLDIAGFRSLKEVSWEPGRLNVIIGPNGSGKSNLLRFLELISVAVEGKLRKHIQSLGGMDSVVWDGKAESISFNLETEPADSPGGPADYELEMARLGTSSYKIERESLRGSAKLNRPTTLFLHRSDLLSGMVGVEVKGPLDPSILSEQEALFSLALFPYFTDPRISQFRKQLASMAVYHDFDLGSDSVIRRPPVAQFEKRVDFDGQNLIPVLHTLYSEDYDFKERINSAMSAAFGNDFEELIFAPAADQRIQFRVKWRTLKRATTAADLSDGTLRFLLLLTILANPLPPALIAIDEPETGLHPSMLPIIAEYAVDASERAQIIFTTHSPQFLDAFTDTKPTTTVAKWRDGETTLHNVSDQELSYWLKEYSLGALFKSGELEAM